MVEIRRATAKDKSMKSATRSRKATVAGMVESIIGCKWSLQVLAQLRRGIHRPGELTRACQGISTKVLNERLNTMLRFGIIERNAFPEIPPRVEYHLTDFGTHFIGLIDEVDKLQHTLDIQSDDQ